jgi:Tripartite tricarboxylate transporter TctB family
MKKLEGLLLAILGGFAVTFLFLSREYNSTAALFPRLIAVASLLFLVLSRIGGRRKNSVGNTGSDPLRCEDSHTSETSPSREGSDPIFPTEFSLRPPILALQAGYVVFIYLLGFFTATLLYLIAAPIQLRYERRAVVIATGVVLTLLLAGSFMWLFDIQLPPGAIWEML